MNVFWCSMFFPLQSAFVSYEFDHIDDGVVPTINGKRQMCKCFIGRNSSFWILKFPYDLKWFKVTVQFTVIEVLLMITWFCVCPIRAFVLGGGGWGGRLRQLQWALQWQWLKKKTVLQRCVCIRSGKGVLGNTLQ